MATLSQAARCAFPRKRRAAHGNDSSGDGSRDISRRPLRVCASARWNLYPAIIPSTPPPVCVQRFSGPPTPAAIGRSRQASRRRISRPVRDGLASHPALQLRRPAPRCGLPVASTLGREPDMACTVWAAGTCLPSSTPGPELPPPTPSVLPTSACLPFLALGSRPRPRICPPSDTRTHAPPGGFPLLPCSIPSIRLHHRHSLPRPSPTIHPPGLSRLLPLLLSYIFLPTYSCPSSAFPSILPCPPHTPVPFSTQPQGLLSRACFPRRTLQPPLTHRHLCRHRPPPPRPSPSPAELPFASVNPPSGSQPDSLQSGDFERKKDP